MNPLSVENLGGMIKSGGAEGSVSETRLQQVMKDNGMPAAGGEVPEAGGFSKLLSDSIARVNEDQKTADHSIKELVAGRSKNMHEVMLTLEKADSSLKLAMQVRNKMLEAYKEIMRMQV